MDNFERENTRIAKQSRLAIWNAKWDARQAQWDAAEAEIKGTWREWVVSLISVLWFFFALFGFAAVAGGVCDALGANYQTFQNYGWIIHVFASITFFAAAGISYPVVRRTASLAMTGRLRKGGSTELSRHASQPESTLKH